MASYENYTKTSDNYDATRVAVGTEIILGCLMHASVRPEQSALLDAGCGTGNYSRELLRFVRHISAVDISAAMIKQARRKFKSQEAAGRVSFCQASIEALPYDGSTFDGVVVNQVLHHLNDESQAGYPAHSRAIREFARVLKPGGVLVLHTSSQRQLAQGMWYYKLIPEAAKRLQRRYAPVEDLKRELEKGGFDCRGSFVPLESVLQGRAYFECCGPLSQSWRDGDSVWALASKQELDEVIAFLRTLGKEGELDAYFASADGGRLETGQVTFLYAVRR